ncbi:MAG: phosphoribosylformylglycinamidine synthase subunit PurL [Herpetosiphonaceae bacterium]|nr:MAG: phosphoribosylformylglycinamidine synthase subunit PurL [Herpetosiphonaceae bacterium]
MQAYLVTIRSRIRDRRPHPAVKRALLQGIDGLRSIEEQRLYLLAGAIEQEQVEALTAELLADPVSEEALVERLADPQQLAPHGEGALVEVAFRPGVTDAEAESVLIGAQRAGYTGLHTAKTLRRYVIDLAAEDAALPVAAGRLLLNDLIETAYIGVDAQAEERLTFYHHLLQEPPSTGWRIRTLPLREASDEELMRISREGILSLSLEEMRAIQAYFRREGRDPTDGELETLAQTWSEHCRHKTFRARIRYTGPIEQDIPNYPALHELSGGAATIDGLLKHYLMRATEAVKQPWLLSAFIDNAGIIAFGPDYEVSFKVETHNHPSALEPFGGANTGVGGVVRDVLGVSAQPVANTDVLCFGPPDMPAELLPPGVLHPQRIAEGVVAGIRDYGNKLGVPTVNGTVIYDEGYIANPLVFCGTVGLAPRGAHPRQAQPGDAIVVVGGRTGRDGIHGATFSSAELSYETIETVGAAVQIGHPITEKLMIDVLLQARDERLYNAITDCGAGGLSSAVGEMGAEIGAQVELRDVPLKYPGLQPWEIWLSEAQERMVLAVPQQSLDRFLSLCRSEDVEAAVIGQFTDSGRLVVAYEGQTLVDLAMEFLHDGVPRMELEARWEPVRRAGGTQSRLRDARAALLAILSHPTVASKEAIVRTYDHEVQGATVLKPLVGVGEDGPGDAAVIQPLHNRQEGLALGNGICPRYGKLDPYWMALAAVDEALRNVVAVGGDPEQTAILDNFCWGDPRLPDRLGGLVRAAAGCHDAAVALGTPFISGKDSLNNEYRDADGRRVAIPPTLLISALALVPDVRRTVSMDLKAVGSAVYVIGETRAELGGAMYGAIGGVDNGHVPRVDLAAARRIFRALHRAIMAGLVRSCHDLSDGGLAAAAAEMGLAGRLGMLLDLRAAPRSADIDDTMTLLFSESPSRFLVEVPEDAAADFERLLADVPYARLGQVRVEPWLVVVGLDGEETLRVSLDEIGEAFLYHRSPGKRGRDDERGW